MAFLIGIFFLFLAGQSSFRRLTLGYRSFTSVAFLLAFVISLSLMFINRASSSSASYLWGALLSFLMVNSRSFI